MNPVKPTTREEAEQTAFDAAYKKHLFLTAVEEFRKNFFAGKATSRDMLNFFKTFPPELRNSLARHTEGQIFQPGIYEETIGLFELAVTTPDTPEKSQKAAIARIFLKQVFDMDFETWLFQLVPSFFNIKRHVEHNAPLRPESLQTHDKYLAGLAKFGAPKTKQDPVILERMGIPDQDKNRIIPAAVKQALSTKPGLYLDRLLQNLQLPVLKTCLLKFWCEIPTVEPKIGLCEFTYSAIVQLCRTCFDPKGLTPDKFDESKVHDAIRRMKLIRKNPPTVTRVMFRAQKLSILLNGEEVLLSSRGD